MRDSVELRVPDSVLLANPSRVIRSRSGSIAVLDEMEYNIKLFDRTGSYLRTIGHRGTGPGEIGRLTVALFTDDSTLLVPDGGRGRILRYKVDGTLLTDTEGVAGALGGVAMVGGRVAIAAYVRRGDDPRDTGAVASITWVSADGRRGRSSVPIPVTHREHPRFLSRPPIVAGVAGPGERVALVTWGWADSLYLVDSAGRVVRAGALPNSAHFKNATTSAEVVERSSLGDAFDGNTPLLDLAGLGDRFVVSAVDFSGHQGRIWYRILDRDLRPIAVDLVADLRLFPGTDGGLVGLRARMDPVRHEPVYSVLTVRPCT